MDIPNIPKGPVLTPYGFNLEELEVLKENTEACLRAAKALVIEKKITPAEAIKTLVYAPRIIFKANILIEFLKIQ